MNGSAAPQSTVSRIFRRIRPLLDRLTAQHAAQVAAQARTGAVLVDGFVAPTEPAVTTCSLASTASAG